MSVIDLLGEFEEPRVHTYGKPHVASEGMRRISHMLASAYGIYLPSGFVPLLETSRGKMPIRVQKYMRDIHDIKLTSSEKQDIGNIVEQYALKGKTFIFDFTNEVLSWRRGSFGNSGSCWRSSYASSVPMFKLGVGHGPGVGLRLFKPVIRAEWYNRGLHGYGRCWIMPIADDRFIMFNAYGERMAVFTSIVMGILGDKFKVLEVSLRNENDGLYMNNNGGVVVLPKSETSESDIMLDIPRMYTLECRACGNRFGSETKGGVQICPDCRDRCAVTGKIVPKSDLMYVENVNLTWRGEVVHLEHGKIGTKMQDQLWFCYKCLEWRGDADKC